MSCTHILGKFVSSKYELYSFLGQVRQFKKWSLLFSWASSLVQHMIFTLLLGKFAISKYCLHISLNQFSFLTLPSIFSCASWLVLYFHQVCIKSPRHGWRARQIRCGCARRFMRRVRRTLGWPAQPVRAKRGWRHSCFLVWGAFLSGEGQQEWWQRASQVEPFVRNLGFSWIDPYNCFCLRRRRHDLCLRRRRHLLSLRRRRHVLGPRRRRHPLGLRRRRHDLSFSPPGGSF